ncbi:MAG: response regulator [Candidatus Aminicenantes bacterium]|nr:response regulator [Candidatus Aminicenantes bacterium]
MAYKAIIADTSRSVTEALRTAFLESGFDVYSFSNGEEVITSIPHIGPDAFVLGISLEEKGGIEVAKFLRDSKDHSDVPVIFLINAFEELDEDKISNIPHHGLFRVPFDSGEVARRIRSFLEEEQGMDTLPEEPSLDEIAEIERSVQKRLDAAEKIMSTQIRNIVKKEIYEAAKEVEKRVKAGVLKELQDEKNT